MEHFKGFYFTQALYWICKLLGLDYYKQKEKDNDLIEDWKWINKLLGKIEQEDDKPLKPLPESVLEEYIKYPHEVFLNDGISIQTQKEFEICYSLRNDRIIIPIRDELGTLVGVKGRSLREEDIENGSKYLPDYAYSKSKILYGLNKTLPYIKSCNEVIVSESEKGIMQLWSMKNFRNGVGIAGHSLDNIQVEKLIKLNTPIVIAYDKVDKKNKKLYDEMKNSIQKAVDDLKLFTTVYIVWDTEDILEDKESPMDNWLKWEYLYKNKILIK